MNGINYIGQAIEQKLLQVRTADLARVVSVDGNTARLQPLTMHKAVGGNAIKQSIISAVIPQNIKVREQTITYMANSQDTGTLTVLVPDELAVDDIVIVGVCDRDISNAKRGVISEATNRHHDINDSVILRVL